MDVKILKTSRRATHLKIMINQNYYLIYTFTCVDDHLNIKINRHHYHQLITVILNSTL